MNAIIPPQIVAHQLNCNFSYSRAKILYYAQIVYRSILIFLTTQYPHSGFLEQVQTGEHSLQNSWLLIRFRKRIFFISRVKKIIFKKVRASMKKLKNYLLRIYGDLEWLTELLN